MVLLTYRHVGAQVDPNMKKQMRDSVKLDYLLTAAIIRNLKIVNVRLSSAAAATGLHKLVVHSCSELTGRHAFIRIVHS